MDICSASGFLCKLASEDSGIAYHVTVCFLDAERPSEVLFTSFVGPGRRSFSVLVPHDSPTELLTASREALCRRAIGHVIRDRLHDKTREGNYVLDLAAIPWEGELQQVGAKTRMVKSPVSPRR